MTLLISKKRSKLVAASLAAVLAAGCDGGPVTITITTNSQSVNSSSSSNAPQDESYSSYDTSHLYNSSQSYSSYTDYSPSSLAATSQPPITSYSSYDYYSSNDAYSYSSSDVYTYSSYYSEPDDGSNVSVGSLDLGQDYWESLCIDCHTHSAEAPMEGYLDLNIREWHWEDFSDYVYSNMPKHAPDSCNQACARHITAFLLDQEGLLEFVNNNPNAPYPDIPTTSSSSEHFEDDFNPLIFELDAQSIDDQGIAFAIDKNMETIFYGAIGGASITSPHRADGTEGWTHSFRDQLVGIRLSEDGQLLMATLGTSVRLIDPLSGETISSISTPNGSAIDTFSAFDDLIVVTQEQGKHFASTYRLEGMNGIVPLFKHELIGPTSFAAEYGAVWARVQLSQTKALITKCIVRGGGLFCDDEIMPSSVESAYNGYVIEEFSGRHLISPDDQWIVTQGNNLLSTDGTSTLLPLGWSQGRQGFIDFDFSPSGTLAVIDNTGRPQAYLHIEPGAKPSSLDPDGTFDQYNLIKIIALDNGVFAIIKLSSGQFALAALGQTVFDVDTPYSSSSSENTSSSSSVTQSTPEHSSSASGNSPRYSFANAPSIEWVTAAGWQIDNIDYPDLLRSVNVAPVDMSQTLPPRSNEQFTDLAFHVSAFDRTKRYQISFEIASVNGEAIDLAAKLYDQVIIIDGSEQVASGYIVALDLLNTALAAPQSQEAAWQPISGEFDFWGSSALAIRLISQSGEPFYIRNLAIEEVGESNIGGGLIPL